MEPKAGINRLITDKVIVSWFRKDKERDRFYLLPGMGGKAMRRKRKIMLQWAIAAGIFVSLVLGCVLYWFGAK